MTKWGLSQECKAGLRFEDQGYQKKKNQKTIIVIRYINRIRRKTTRSSQLLFQVILNGASKIPAQNYHCRDVLASS